jgi:hypothetical protein
MTGRTWAARSGVGCASHPLQQHDAVRQFVVRVAVGREVARQFLRHRLDAAERAVAELAARKARFDAAGTASSTPLSPACATVCRGRQRFRCRGRPAADRSARRCCAPCPRCATVPRTLRSRDRARSGRATPPADAARLDDQTQLAGMPRFAVRDRPFDVAQRFRRRRRGRAARAGRGRASARAALLMYSPRSSVRSPSARRAAAPETAATAAESATTAESTAGAPESATAQATHAASAAAEQRDEQGDHAGDHRDEECAGHEPCDESHHAAGDQRTGQTPERASAARCPWPAR